MTQETMAWGSPMAFGAAPPTVPRFKRYLRGTDPARKGGNGVVAVQFLSFLTRWCAHLGWCKSFAIKKKKKKAPVICATEGCLPGS